jgi:UDP-N-acetylglucosamine 2-epimerase (non-hydrolysing)
MKPIVDLIAGARPNFMKLAPVERCLRAEGALQLRIIHTGQHYDAAMTDVFFEELGIPVPDVHLDVGSGTQGAQTARIVERYEAHLLENRPAACVVFGDVNSTIACALAAVKLGVPVAHVEAGLRSFDRTMPEEINRLLTDAIADLLLVTEESGIQNLRREGVPEERIKLVGNVMIDSLFSQLSEARARQTSRTYGFAPKHYGFVTLHRPSNVDDPGTLSTLLDVLHAISERLPLVFAVHPRTLNVARRAGFEQRLAPDQPRLKCVGPQKYLDTVSLVADSAVVLTDSGGLQEESSVLRVPCLTLRENTERPITVSRGTSRLVGNDPVRIRAAFDDVVAGRWPEGQEIPMWDGRAGQRVAQEIVAWVRRHSEYGASAV